MQRPRTYIAMRRCTRLRGPLALYRGMMSMVSGKHGTLIRSKRPFATRADQLIVDQDIELTQLTARNSTFPIGPIDGTVQDAHFHNGQRVLV
jgi:hypothetical protein